MTVKLAIFDCDGTMVDSQANICRAMEVAFTKEKLDAPDHHVTRRVVGLSLVEAMHALLPEAERRLHEVLAEHYKAAFTELRSSRQIDEPLYDGLADILQRLGDAGWLLAVATGKSDRGLTMCLDHHGLADRFISLQTADRHPSKPHPAMVLQAMADAGADAGAEPVHTAMIGDTSYDMEMGVNAGVRPIGVNWGYHAPEELRQAGAESVAASMPGLFDILERRNGG